MINDFNNCFSCKWLTQGEARVHCNHKEARKYKKIRVECDKCGRKPGVNRNGCGKCIGRGSYCYPNAYDQCDINKWEKK